MGQKINSEKRDPSYTSGYYGIHENQTVNRESMMSSNLQGRRHHKPRNQLCRQTSKLLGFLSIMIAQQTPVRFSIQSCRHDSTDLSFYIQLTA